MFQSLSWVVDRSDVHMNEYDIEYPKFQSLSWVVDRSDVLKMALPRWWQREFQSLSWVVDRSDTTFYTKQRLVVVSIPQLGC